MADNILWRHIQKQLRLKIGDEAYGVWHTAQSPTLDPFEDGNTITIRVTGQGDYQMIGQEIMKILSDMGFEKPSVRFQSGKESLIVENDLIKDIYASIVRPDRAIPLPGYIQRWVSQQIGVDGFFMVASLRQGTYEAGFREDNGSVFTGRFSAKQIAARAGITTRTYWNRMADQEFWQNLKGLVTRHDEPKLWINENGQPRQAARRFSVFSTMPLTPRDTAHLRRWITQNIEVCGGPEGVLRAAVETPVVELIGDGSASHAEDALTVLELVSSMFKDQVEPKLLVVLASNLHGHIIPSGDIVKISIFFLENILPVVGPSAGYLITIMRDRCFVNRDVRRTTVTFQGGWDEIADRVGLTGERRAKTVWEWLNAKYPSSHKDAGKLRNAVARLYIAEIVKTEPELDFEHQSRTFQVEMDEIPRYLLEAVVTERGPYAKIFSENFCTHGMAEIAHDPVWNELKKLLHTRDGAFFNVSENFCTHVMARFSSDIKTFSQLKALKLLNQLLNTNQPTPVEPAFAEAALASELVPESSAATQEPETPVGQSVWNFSKLAQISDVNPSRVTLMTSTVPDDQERVLRFVGWILHAHSPKAKNLKDTSGVGLAISSIGKRPENACMRLAKLGPEKLRALFDSDFARTLGDGAEEMIYRANLKRLPLHRKQDLYYRLFGVDAPEPVSADTAISGDGALASAIAENDGASGEPKRFKVPRRQIKVTQ